MSRISGMVTQVHGDWLRLAAAIEKVNRNKWRGNLVNLFGDGMTCAFLTKERGGGGWYGRNVGLIRFVISWQRHVPFVTVGLINSRIRRRRRAATPVCDLSSCCCSAFLHSLYSPEWARAAAAKRRDFVSSSLPTYQARHQFRFWRIDQFLHCRRLRRSSVSNSYVQQRNNRRYRKWYSRQNEIETVKLIELSGSLELVGKEFSLSEEKWYGANGIKRGKHGARRRGGVPTKRRRKKKRRDFPRIRKYRCCKDGKIGLIKRKKSFQHLYKNSNKADLIHYMQQ